MLSFTTETTQPATLQLAIMPATSVNWLRYWQPAEKVALIEKRKLKRARNLAIRLSVDIPEPACEHANGSRNPATDPSSP